MVKADLHIHSKYSVDSLSSPKQIVSAAVKRGIGVIAVTDHESLEGSIAVEKFLRSSGTAGKVELVKGMEVHSDIGDILCLFIQEPVKSKKIGTIMDRVRDQDGIVVLPHPYESHRFGQEDDFLAALDGVETFNARTSAKSNEKAKSLARRLGAAFIGGSDSHTADTIGDGYTRFKSGSDPLEDLRKAIKERKTSAKGRPSSKYFWYKSDLVRSFKEPRLTRIPRSAWGLLKYGLGNRK